MLQYRHQVRTKDTFTNAYCLSDHSAICSYNLLIHNQCSSDEGKVRKRLSKIIFLWTTPLHQHHDRFCTVHAATCHHRSTLTLISVLRLLVNSHKHRQNPHSQI